MSDISYIWSVQAQQLHGQGSGKPLGWVKIFSNEKCNVAQGTLSPAVCIKVNDLILVQNFSMHCNTLKALSHYLAIHLFTLQKLTHQGHHWGFSVLLKAKNRTANLLVRRRPALSPEPQPTTPTTTFLVFCFVFILCSVVQNHMPLT